MAQNGLMKAPKEVTRASLGDVGDAFVAAAEKAAEPSDHSATPLGSYCGDYCTIFYIIPKNIYIL